MNGPVSTRRGSALLVVLGMLSFMVISGLAFSVFMRTTRLASNFTRRTVTTRQLAKAALAEAIDRIDRSIANDPHPNIRTASGAGTTDDSYNYWLGRVLMMPDETGITRKLPRELVEEINANPNAENDLGTVPVLSLEALAYLPPSLVNEARFYGQKTPTAVWQTFDFDAGRYAFVALDVSDYLDVNRLLPDQARSSHPAQRVTFGHLFETFTHNTPPSRVDEWKTFMENYRQVEADGTFSFNSKTPLVSLADFNLALGEQTQGGFRSPFVQYLKNGSDNRFYQSSPGSETFEQYAAMTFVTDSLDAAIPKDEETTLGREKWTILNLDDEQNQIFTEAFLDAPQEDRPLTRVSSLRTEPFDRLVQTRVPYVTMYALSDYLDCNRVPITLGMPSVERVPMICGISPQLGSSSVKVSILTNPDTGGSDQQISGSMAAKDPVVRVRRNFRWRLDAHALASGFLGGRLQALVAYPFRNHERTSEGASFQLDGKIQLFLSSETMRLRTGNKADLLHWGASGSAANGGLPGLNGNAVVNLPLSAQMIQLNETPTRPEDCVSTVTFSLNMATEIMNALDNEKGDLINVTYEWERHLVDEKTGEYDNAYAGELPDEKALTDASSSLWPLKADGTVDAEFSGLTKESVKNLKKDLQLNFVVTLRVISSSGVVLGEGSSGVKTVDLVPATIYDDLDLNGVDNSIPLAQPNQAISGEPTPLMKFETGVSAIPVRLDLTATTDQPVTLSPSAVMVDDPRYNHAPENWQQLSSFSESGWIAAQTSGANDGDIFMATSDQDYMQSVYEFAFLPRHSDLDQYRDAIRGNLPGYPSGSASWERLCSAAPIDRDLMWKTYDIFGKYSDAGDDFEGLGLENLARGLRVSPYSDSTNIIMGAFANTPHDWRAASENEAENAGVGSSLAAFNKKFAWNEYSSGSKLAWEDLEAVAGAFMEKMNASVQNNGTWKDALIDLFDQERARDTEKYLCGIELMSPSDALYGVDKKFLYGYWRNCFAARQQLFLVFFRAEPMMLGGGVAGVTPPQLGAKGVAVVWRNPNRTNGSNRGYQQSGLPEASYQPHQTRVLFYRQFE